MEQIHYNAFISYRHCPVDSKVAEAVQKQLEHFRIPRPIRKKYGTDRIRRVFRDKEELPLCNDLGDSITAALANSDFLILICSPRTKASLWVTREIEIFLQTHSVDRILVVLAEGEPEDVVPPVLTHGREPLHCDFRLKPRRAKAEELPRLVAAMIGCGYDDLIQRQKQYKTRRITGALSVLLAMSVGLTAYFIRTSQQIRHHYEEQLRSQSLYLANESLQLLNAGDRMGAIDLALAALPGEGNERPWIPEAEHALGMAVGAYTVKDDVRCIGSLRHHGVVYECLISPDQAFIISRDSTDRVYVWDLDSRVLQYSIPIDDTIAQMILMEENRLLINGYNVLQCYDLPTGELLWKGSEDVGQSIYCSATEELFIATSYSAPYILNGKDGNLVFALEDREGEKVLAVSEDGRYIAYTISPSYSQYQIRIYDRTKGTTVQWERSLEKVHQAAFCGDRLMVIGMIEESYGMSLGYTYTTMSEKVMDLFSISLADGGEQWHREMPFYFENYFIELSFGEMGTTPTVFATLSNLCYAVDLETGEILQTLQMPDSIVGICEEATQLRWFLKNGFLWLYEMGDTEGGGIRYVPNDIDMGQLNGIILAHVIGEKQLLVYGRSYDKSLVLSEDPPSEYLSYIGRNNSYILLDTTYKGTLRCLSREGKLLWEQEVSYAEDLIAMTDTEAYFYESLGEVLYRCKLEDGSLEELPLLIPDTDAYMETSPVIWNGELLYVVREMDYDAMASIWYLYSQPLTGGEIGKVLLTMEELPHMSKLALHTVADGLLLQMQDYTEEYDLQHIFYTLDPQGQGIKVTEFIAPSDLKSFVISYGKEGAFLIRAAEGVCLYHGEGERLIPGEFLSGTYDEVGDMLLLLNADGNLCFYNDEGLLLDEVPQYTASGTVSEYTEVSWTVTEENIAVQIDSVCNLVHRDSHGVYAYVYPCLFYDEKQDRFYVELYQSGGSTLGYFRRYTTEDLIAKGKALLGDNGLTEEQKKEYGILNTD